MLELRNVTKIVGVDTHISDISLTFETGSLNVLLGPTLSGKTSLMRLMAGLDKPASGTILVDGEDVTGRTVQKRNVAMVYQQFINYPNMSVYENIASPLRLAGLSKVDIDRAVRQAADLMKLGEFLDRKPLNLSGGQQQRTALARAIVKNAKLVLLDEPLANLDYKLREELREELPKIFAEAGTVFVYATTEPTEALLLGGSTVALHEGRVIQFGKTVDVFRDPLNLTAAQIFSDPPMNTIDVKKVKDKFVLGDKAAIMVPASYQGLADGAYRIGFRAYHLGVSAQNSKNASVLEGVVRVTEITGSESYVHLECLGQSWVLIARGVHDYAPSEKIKLEIDTKKMFVFDQNGQTLHPTTQEEAA